MISVIVSFLGYIQIKCEGFNFFYCREIPLYYFLLIINNIEVEHKINY